ncbi:hypothetical protein V1524DRAFT_444255, partial [Lipomyces starkeyi]
MAAVVRDGRGYPVERCRLFLLYYLVNSYLYPVRITRQGVSSFVCVLSFLSFSSFSLCRYYIF